MMPSYQNFSNMVRPPFKPKLSSIEVQDQKKTNPDIFNPMFDDSMMNIKQVEDEPIVHNPRQITTAALQKCNVLRLKNKSTVPLQKGDGIARIIHTRQEMREVRKTVDNFYNANIHSGKV